MGFLFAVAFEFDNVFFTVVVFTFVRVLSLGATIPAASQSLVECPAATVCPLALTFEKSGRCGIVNVQEEPPIQAW